MPEQRQKETSDVILVSPDGKKYPFIMYAIKGYWEWYGFEVAEKNSDDVIYFGYVMGDFPELGYFSLRELQSVGASICTKKEELEELMPPIGWTRQE